VVKKNQSNQMSKINLIHLISHPIQYQTPLYERFATDTDVDFQVLYCSKIGVETTKDVEFGVAIKWDIPLLSDYKYRFLKNYAIRETLDSFGGLLNLGIIKTLYTAKPKSIIWIHGWNYATIILTLIVGKLFGHRIFLRGENTALIEHNKPNTFVKRLKTFWLSQVLFKMTDAFLAVGNQNRDYFRLLKVPENKMAWTPYCIDNQRFIAFKNAHKNDIPSIRKRLGIPLSKKVIICSGKYIDKKRPLDVLKALTLLPNLKDVFVVFVGEGNLRSDMETFITAHNLQDHVLLTGFVNQSQMPDYYLAADLYVMASGMYETWGLSTNEALCFGLPIILSDMVGSAYDLIDGNGFMYPSGDCNALAHYIHHVFSLPESDFLKMKQRSTTIIEAYSYDSIIEGIKTAARQTEGVTPFQKFVTFGKVK
jgi:glycosyltransferase involved in cell wall biosynthesis